MSEILKKIGELLLTYLGVPVIKELLEKALAWIKEKLGKK